MQTVTECIFFGGGGAFSLPDSKAAADEVLASSSVEPTLLFVADETIENLLFVEEVILKLLCAKSLAESVDF